MKNVAIYFSAYPCSSAEPSAGSQLAVQKVKSLASDYERVFVFSFFRSKLQSEKNFPSNVFVKDLNISWWHTFFSQVIFPFHPLGVGVRKLVAKKINFHDLPEPDLVYIDFTQAYGCVPKRWLAKTELRIHDVVTELYGRQSRAGSILRRLIGFIESMRWAWYEPYALRSSRVVHCLTDREADFVRRYKINKFDVVIERPIPSYVCRTRKPDSVYKGRIIFWGNLARPENSLAVEYFIDKIWPSIKSAVPFATFRVVGANPSKNILERVSPDISITGFVEDPTKEFELAHVAVAPLTFGAGIKIKVLETAFSGIPTICSNIAADGIWDDVPNIFVAQDDNIFAKKCIDQLLIK